MMLHIASSFDGGNIECVSCQSADEITLRIRKDNRSDFLQWFYFRLTGARGQVCRLRVENAGKASYPQGFENYHACASYDRERWFRVASDFDGQALTIELTPQLDSLYLAYFVPYSMERHADLVASAVLSSRVAYERLGATVDGQDIDLLRIGDGDENKKKLWAIARQHPGETMAQWWMEGFIERLLDESDPVARELLKAATVYVVPNMNPDGSRRGNLRTNAAGRNLNREWNTPSESESPEVFFVRNKMHGTGVDLCLDVHGDEALPYNFIAGSEGNPSWDDERQAALDYYKDTLMTINPDFQITHGYPVEARGTANFDKCTNYVAETFGCLAMTLEMPFKDTVDTPDSTYGWSPDRCRRLGEANVDAMLRYLRRP